MATGFMQRFKGRIGVALGGIYQNGVQSVAIFTSTGAPTDGTSGTLAGLTFPGVPLVDTVNGVMYINAGSSSSPTYNQFGRVSVTAGSTAATISNSGLTTLGSTTVGAAFTLAAPTVAGQSKTLFVSTAGSSSQTVTMASGAFQSTAGSSQNKATFTLVGQCLRVEALSTAAFAVVGNIGAVTFSTA